MILKEDVEKIAHLARLQLPEGKVEEIREHFNKIISYFRDIESVDTKGVLPLVTPHEIAIALREDVVKKDLSRDEVLQNAPDIKDSLFKVPPVV